MAGFPQGAVALFLCVFAVAACNATPPNDVASGVGFQDYQQWQARRAMLRGDAVVQPAPAPQPSTVRPPLPPVTAALPPLAQTARLTPPPATQPITPAPQAAIIARRPPSPPPAPPVAPEAQAQSQTDVTRIAAAAIAAAEAQPSTAARPVTPPPLTRAGVARVSDEQDFDAVA